MHIRKRLTVLLIGIATTLFLAGILVDFAVTYDKKQATSNLGSDSFDLMPASERSKSVVTDENNSDLTITLRSNRELQFYIEFHEDTGWEKEYSKYNISQLDNHFLLRQPGEWNVRLRNNSSDEALHVSYSMNVTAFATEVGKPYYWIRNPTLLSGSFALFLIAPVNLYDAIRKKWNKTASEILVFSIIALLVLGSGPILGSLLGTRNPFACPTTPSMEPAIWPGDLVIIGGSNPKDLTDGDIIAYDMLVINLANPNPEKMAVPILHRIAGIVAQNGSRYFITKGDNNPATDDWYVPEEGVIGKAIYIIPYVGNIVITLSRLEIKILIIAIMVAIVLLWPSKKPKPSEEKK
jgi:signal peptidase